MNTHSASLYGELEPSIPRMSLTHARWWLLHMDQYYSMTLRCPLGISAIGDCDPPIQLTSDTTAIRISQYTSNFTILARQILCEQLNNIKIDQFSNKLLR